VEKNFNNQIDIILKNIKSLENCIKPASKYRLKSCIKREQEGSKGFNYFPELSKLINSNKKTDCKVRFNDIKRSLQNLASLDEGNASCQKLFVREIIFKVDAMTYENYKNGMFRVFIVLSIPLELVTYFQYDLSFANKFFYSLEILSQTLVIFGCIYLISLLIAKPFIGFMGKK
jgi:hypothetical protein